jgi:hypothetical protein
MPRASFLLRFVNRLMNLETNKIRANGQAKASTNARLNRVIYPPWGSAN